MKNLLYIILLTGFSAFAQGKKIEQEDRISGEKMPEAAMQLINSEKPDNARRLKFYFETDGETTSYEAKFKFKGHDYSVEFNNNGILEDIEVELKKKNLPEAALQKIKSFIEENNERHKIEKIQAQYLPALSEIKAFAYAKNIQQNVPQNYELIVAVKNDGKLQRFEMLFDNSGNFIEKREVIRNEYDYLLF
ncbi:hypothetical protein [Autumnicola musiva]|uniref:PepSY domain-containing protein n=1 Tax=Autumnicola musiva TaxID=3075589 RepID=A0ABU3DA57_9FLAO|nr:hypothetical protein [Zunongwangia sp. F117]MDT0678422.1 hypothetical protein [Zunongwangia sp. F117]